MNLRSLFLLLVLSAIGSFAALNWSVIMMPTDLNLLFASVHAPLGLVMLGLIVFLLAIFLVYLVYLQTTVLIDARSHAKELQANRRLADQAEASRFTELHNFLDMELKALAQRQQSAQQATLARIAELEHGLIQAQEQNSNSLAASLGELDERLRSGERIRS